MSLFRETLLADDEFYDLGYRKKQNRNNIIIYESMKAPIKYIELNLSVTKPFSVSSYDSNNKALPLTSKELIVVLHKANEYYKYKRRS